MEVIQNILKNSKNLKENFERFINDLDKNVIEIWRKSRVMREEF